MLTYGRDYDIDYVRRSIPKPGRQLPRGGIVVGSTTVNVVAQYEWTLKRFRPDAMALWRGGRGLGHRIVLPGLPGRYERASIKARTWRRYLLRDVRRHGFDVEEAPKPRPLCVQPVA